MPKITLIEPRHEGDEQLQTLINEISAFYGKCGFEVPGMLDIKNESEREVPIFCPKEKNRGLFTNDTIILCVKNGCYWCQIIFQFSHEYTHYIIHNQDRAGECIGWIEESICEAMSLIMLYWFQTYWRESSLYQQNPGYDKSIRAYLNDCLSQKGNLRLSNCHSEEDLIEINEKAQIFREWRREEVKMLAENINSPEDMMALFLYRKYIIGKSCLLNTMKYLSDFGNSRAARYICQLQSSILQGKGDIIL